MVQSIKLKIVCTLIISILFLIQHVWTFELGTQEGINSPLWTFVGFQQQDRKVSQNLNNITFYRPPVRSAQCVISTKSYLDSGIFF